jgi:hypothetical protein
MRYQFDITMDRYIDKLRVGRYHGNMNISGLSFVDMTFATRMAMFLDAQQCAPGGAKVVYVIQTGSWDLQFFPPRGFIDSPYQGRAVIQAISGLLARASAHCPGSIRVIYMTTMPHPWCPPKDEHCIRLANYWRNNPNVKGKIAYMHYFFFTVHHIALPFATVVMRVLQLHIYAQYQKFITRNQSYQFLFILFFYYFLHGIIAHFSIQ